MALGVGEEAAGVEAVVFDRGGNKYHGRIAAIADGFLAALTSRAAEPVKETPETEQVEPDVSKPVTNPGWLVALIEFIVSLFQPKRP